MILHRFVAYDPGGARRAPLPNVSGWSYSSPFDDKPGLTFSYQDGMPGWDALLTPCEVAIETSIDAGLTWTEKPNMRFLRLARGYESGPERMRKYTLASYAFLLSKAQMTYYDGLDKNGKYVYSGATAGGILRDMIDTSQIYDWAPSLTCGFTGLVDSAGAVWAPKIEMGYEPGVDLWAVLADLTDKGYIDWYFQGRELRVFNADTTLAVTRPVFVQRNDLTKLSIDGSLEDLVHVVTVFGDSDTELSTNITTGTTPRYWGRWSTAVSSSGMSGGAMQAQGRAILADQDHEQIQYAATVDLSRSVYTPLYDFAPGDYVSMEDEAGIVQPFRIRGINFSRSNQGDVACTLIVNDRFVEASLRAQRKQNGINSGIGAIGGTAGTVVKPVKGKVTPYKGTLTSLTATSYINPSGYSRAMITIVYAPVTSGLYQVNKKGNTRIVTMTPQRYEFQGSISNGLNQWEDWGHLNDFGPEYQRGLAPNTTYLVRYAAVSEDGTIGPWSDSMSVVTPQDVDPPAKPSAPTVSTRLGQLIVNWDGKDSTGAAMSKDFLRCDIRIIGVTDPVGVFYNGKTPVIVPNVVIGQSYQVYLRPFDRQNNQGADSDYAPAITVKGIMDDPQAAVQIQNTVTIGANTYSPNDPTTGTYPANAMWFKIDANNTVTAMYRWDGTQWVLQRNGSATVASINAGIITSGTLLAARIGASTITGDKLVAGTISAVSLSADAIDGKTISGNTIMGATITGGAFLTKAENLPGNKTIIGFDGRIYSYGVDPVTKNTVMVWDLRPYVDSGSTLSRAGYARFYVPVWAETVISRDLGNTDPDGNFSFGAKTEIRGYNPTYPNDICLLSLGADTDGARLFSMAAYDRTYGAGANMYVSTAGTIARATSATKYKINVEEMGDTFLGTDGEMHERDIFGLTPVTWFDKGASEMLANSLTRAAEGEDEDTDEDIMPVIPIPGFIAEDVEAKLGPEFVSYGADGVTIEGILYDRVTAYLVKKVGQLATRVQELENHV